MSRMEGDLLGKFSSVAGLNGDCDLECGSLDGLEWMQDKIDHSAVPQKLRKLVADKANELPVPRRASCAVPVSVESSPFECKSPSWSLEDRNATLAWRRFFTHYRSNTKLNSTEKLCHFLSRLTSVGKGLNPLADDTCASSLLANCLSVSAVATTFDDEVLAVYSSGTESAKLKFVRLQLEDVGCEARLVREHLVASEVVQTEVSKAPGGSSVFYRCKDLSLALTAVPADPSEQQKVDTLRRDARLVRPSPFIASDFLVLTDKCAVALCSTEDGMEVDQRFDSEALFDGVAVHAEWSEHPKCVHIAAGQRLYQCDFRDRALFHRNSALDELAVTQRVQAMRAFEDNRNYLMLALDADLLLLDVRQMRQPLLSWRHMLRCAPRLLETTVYGCSSEAVFHVAVLADRLFNDRHVFSIMSQLTYPQVICSLESPFRLSSPDEYLAWANVHEPAVVATTALRRRLTAPSRGLAVVDFRRRSAFVLYVNDVGDLFYQRLKYGREPETAAAVELVDNGSFASSLPCWLPYFESAGCYRRAKGGGDPVYPHVVRPPRGQSDPLADEQCPLCSVKTENQSCPSCDLSIEKATIYSEARTNGSSVAVLSGSLNLTEAAAKLRESLGDMESDAVYPFVKERFIC